MTQERQLTPEYQAQRELLGELLKPRPTVIGLEGGPCGGKSTLAERLQTSGTNRQVVILPEAASRHIAVLHKNGTDPGYLAQHDRAGYVAFEAAVLGTIVEDIKRAQEAFAGTDAIIVADRTDIAAYVTAQEYQQILGMLGLDRSPILDLVDQIYYLPTVAHENPDLYDSLKSTNPARYETREEAQATCTATLAAVARHPELHVSWGGYGSFEAKIEALTSSILQPEQESELKLKPRQPAGQVVESMLAAADVLSVHQIAQTYYELDGQIFRLRKTVTENGEELYAYTVKNGEGIHRTEVQRPLTPEQFTKLAKCRRASPTLEKARHNFLHRDTVNVDTLQTSPANRLWVADRYYDRRLEEWNLETDVHDDAEAAFITNIMEQHGHFERATMGAEKLARHLGQLAVA